MKRFLIPLAVFVLAAGFVSGTAEETYDHSTNSTTTAVSTSAPKRVLFDTAHNESYDLGGLQNALTEVGYEVSVAYPETTTTHLDVTNSIDPGQQDDYTASVSIPQNQVLIIEFYNQAPDQYLSLIVTTPDGDTGTLGAWGPDFPIHIHSPSAGSWQFQVESNAENSAAANYQLKISSGPVPIRSELLQEYDALVLGGPLEITHDDYDCAGPSLFNGHVNLLTEEEIDAINQFVSDGGGLLVAGGEEVTLVYDCFPGGGSVNRDGTVAANAVIADYGVEINKDMVIDPTNCDGGCPENPIVHTFTGHQVAQGIDSIVYPGFRQRHGGHSLNVTAPAGVIGKGDEDSYSVYVSNPTNRVYDEYPPVIAALDSSSEKKGRVVVVGEGWLFSDGDSDYDGLTNLNEYDNKQLALNILNWITSIPQIRGRIFAIDETNDSRTVEPIPAGIPVRLHKIERSVQPCAIGKAYKGVLDTTTKDGGLFHFPFGSERDVQCDPFDEEAEQCEQTEQAKDIFIPGELEFDPDNTNGYRAKTTVYYSAGDFNAGKSVYLEVYIYSDRYWWDNDTRHETLTLFPPDGLDASGVFNNRYDGIPDIVDYYPRPTPLLLVHGHGGMAEYWRGLRDPLIKTVIGQTWEVFYPGGEHIVQGSAVLKDGIDLILDRYNIFPQLDEKVDIVAHSMGGPISRAYLAGMAESENNTTIQPYSPKVRRLLLLATPNFGVLSAARIQEGDIDCTNLYNRFIFHHNPDEPALRDLVMGSVFFRDLGNKGLSNKNDVLVVAGTRHTPSLRPFGCFEAQDQDDVMIGLSSASLLSFEYPLAVLYRNHSQMRGTGELCSRALPQPESDGDDNPHNDVNELVRLIEVFLYDQDEVKFFTDLYIQPVQQSEDLPTVYRIWGMRGHEYLEEAPSSVQEWEDLAQEWNSMDGHLKDDNTTYVHHNDTDFRRGSLLLRIVSDAGEDLDVTGVQLLTHLWDAGTLSQNQESKLWYINSGPPLDFGGVLFSGKYSARLLLSDGSRYKTSIEIKPSQTVSTTIPISQMTSFFISYDLNNSGTVDADDIQSISGDWRCKCGDECYNPEHDFDYDCDTDIIEIMSVAAHWEGEPAPTSWTQKSPTIHPSARAGVPMAYSTDQNAIILFGGGLGSGQFSNETWSYDGDNWTQLSPTTSPAPRASHAMVYDSGRDKMVMFGGWDNNTLRQDTWEFDGTNWYQVPVATSPPARHHHAMAYDSMRDRVVLFGGDLPWPGFFDDTWEYDGSDWNQKNPTNHSSARRGHAMAYDSHRDKIVLFGGVDSSQQCLGDTWEYDGSNWVQTATQGPSPRDYASMVYDAARQKMVLFGGGGCGSAFSDTWEYANGVWTQVDTSTAPSPRGQYGMAYDPARQVTVLFGGGGSAGLLDDTWEYGP